MSGKVLVLGGTGVLGRRVVEKLAKSRFKVVGTGMSGRGFEDITKAGATPMQLDVRSKDDVERVFEKVGPEIVVNMVSKMPERLPGAWKGTHILDDHNDLILHATKGIVKAAEKIRPTRMISTSAYFCTTGMSMTKVDNEKTSLDVKSTEAIGIKEEFPGQYSDYKVETRHMIPSVNPQSSPLELPNVDSSVPLLRGFNMACYRSERLHGSYKYGDSVILRLGYLYGPGTTFGKGGEMRKDAENGQLRICAPGTGVWSFIHVDDAAEAVCKAVTNTTASPGIYNLVDNSPASSNEWIVKFSHMAGAQKPPMEIGPMFLNWWSPHLFFMYNKQRAAEYSGFPEAFEWEPKQPPMWACTD
eukprot:TRINITY_DN16705_c0_g1_i1.p1 TRINITY_DN16705_c0_g1~~TRINITY_DN16705_c0_g1_i1.p1  ORF type:complete len:382 (+),score=50.38 TRINITY_DN16705_c0_g1_i1:75-1148(+)